jgi:hypothetical protein
MESQNIKAGKSLVQNSLKASAMQLGLPTPIVNWQTQFFRGTTIYTAFIFIGAIQKRLSFLDQELNALVETEQPTFIKNRIYNALAK